jgi:Tfp pilus assembly protein PilO
MRLPKNYFENLSITKYRAYLKLLPDMKKESTKVVMMLIFTFVGSSFLGIFAISPTISTIVELHKQLEDSQFVFQSLTTKMNNLSSLQEQYDQLSDDLPIVFDAIPDNASVPILIGQIEALAAEKKVTITTLRVGKVQVSKTEKLDKKASSFTFSLEAEGSYDQMTSFASSLSRFNRIVTIEFISLTRDPRPGVLILAVRGKEYFKQ